MPAFLDSRNSAELILGPRGPMALGVVNFSSLKLSFGTANTPPGVISSPAQISGPVRTQLGTSIANKAATAAIATAIGTTLAGFGAQHAALQNGTYVAPDPLLVPSSNGIPNTASFFSFSVLAPGAPIPVSFSTTIQNRQTQLQGINRSVSSVAATASFGGVTVTENYNPTPNPQASQVDLPSVPRLAQGGSVAQADPILQNKLAFVVHGVTIGTGIPNSWSRLLNIITHPPANLNAAVGQLFNNRTNQSTWSEPPTPYNTTFPYNRVQQSTSGHIIEIDDTPGAERVHIYHRSGSFIEFHPDGTVVYKSMKDGYGITMGNQYVKVNGQCNLAVDGDVTLYTKGNLQVQTDGDVNYQCNGDFSVYATNINLKAKEVLTGDGIEINLRYIDLPFSIIPVFCGTAYVGMAPSVNLAAVAEDADSADISTVTSFVPSMDPASGTPVVKFTGGPAPVPPTNPLANFSVYQAKTPVAIDYRARLFDTPEQVNDFVLYTAQVGLESTLGDVSANARQLAGTLSTANTGLVAPKLKPTINYLSYDTYKGNYTYANNYALGGTSILLSAIVDVALYPAFVKDSTLTAFQEPIPVDMGASSGGGTTSASPPANTIADVQQLPMNANTYYGS